MEAPLYEAWLERIDSYYQESYATNIIEEYSQYGGGRDDSREGKGKIFGAGYEVFIYAFFIGLYYGERKPLIGPKKKFRMRMRDWGNVNPKVQKDRQKYNQIQRYIFMALVAKSDIDLIALDRGDLTVDEVTDILMETLNEYTNQGLYLIRNKQRIDPDFFYGNMAFLDFLNMNINHEFVVEEVPTEIPVDDSMDVASPKTITKKKSGRWTIAEDRDLIDYFKSGMDMERLTYTFDRPEEEIIERLKKKGLM